MDTTQDSRENAGKRRPQTDGQKRASQRPGQSAPEQRPRRAAEQSAQERPRRPAEQETQERPRRAPEQNAPEQRRRAAEQSTQERPRRAPEQSAQERPRRPVEQSTQERSRRAAEQTAPEQRRRAPEQNAQERPRRAPEQNAQERPRRAPERDAQRRPVRQEEPDRPAKREAEPRQRAGEEAAARQRAKHPADSRRGAPRRKPVDDDVPNRKRAYGNSKPKKKSALTMLAETLMSAKNRPKTPTPAVIYTQPLPFNRDRLIVQLITVTAVVLAIVMGLSVFFKVETITVTGADTYSAWAVREASGISEGDKLLTFSKIRAASQIMANLPYVKGVRIGIKLPDTVNIMIEEESVVYAIKSSDGQWWMMDSDGRVVEQANNAKAATATQVLGVTLEAPTVNEKGVATEMTPSETNELGELIPVSTTGAQRLTAALQILKALENNDIVGEAASVDVTSTEDIILWYGTRYQVNLGDTSRLDYKVDCMNDAILQMSDYQSGVLDISFTIWPNQVGYTPFA